MRLGQLARKLAVRPSQIVDLLSQQQVHLVEGSNARLEDETVVQIVKHFAPDRISEIVSNLKSEEPESRTLPSQQTQEVLEPESLEQQPEITVQPAGSSEKPEVIKAPKVELSGLKVLGKIELPEPKKKEVIDASSPELDAPPVEKKARTGNRKEQPKFNREVNSQPWRNPIAVQREREARDAEERKKAALEREKERRKEHYLKQVKVSQPTKASRIFDEDLEEPALKPVEVAPKTLWGKFIKWLNN